MFLRASLSRATVDLYEYVYAFRSSDLSERLSIETIALTHAINTSIAKCSKYKRRLFGELNFVQRGTSFLTNPICVPALDALGLGRAK